MVPRDAKSLYEIVQKIQDERNQLEASWKVNLAFYKGRHYTYYNPGLGRLEQLPQLDKSNPRYRVRLMKNEITPNTQSLISKMTKTKPIMHARSQNSDVDSTQATSVAENLLEFFETKLSLPAAKRSLLSWAVIAGDGYAWAYWDPSSGEGEQVMVGPDQQPIMDSLTRTLFQQQLETSGLPPEFVQEQYYKKIDEGDICLKVKSPFDVFVDPAAKTFESADFVIVKDSMKPDDLKARFPNLKDAKPDMKVEPADNQLQGGGPRLSKSTNDAIAVYYGYWRPGGSEKAGRHVIFTSTDMLYDEKWPFTNFSTPPIIQFGAVESPDSVYHRGLVEDAIPLQKDLNRTLSQIVEHKNLTVNPRWLVPVGGFRTPFTNESGGLIEFNPVGNFKPEPIMMPPLQPYVYQHLNELKQDLKDCFFLSEVDKGAVPPNVEAGTAIDLLQEMSTDNIAPMIEAYENSIAALATLLIKYASEFYSVRRITKIVGESNAKKVLAFKRAPSLTIVGESGSGLPRTRAGRQSRVMMMMQAGIIKPEEAWKYFDTADMRSFADEKTRDEDQALREHEKLASGQPLNTMAMQNAMQQIQQQMAQGFDPTQPEPTLEQLQSMIQEAALEPFDFEDFVTHLRVHASFMKGPMFTEMPPEAQMAFNTHFNKTLAKLAETQATQPDPPRITYQVRSAATPTEASAILGTSGVQVDPETLASEVPIDTVVFDSLDKPNAPEDHGETFMATAKGIADVTLTNEKAKLIAAQRQNVGKQQPNQR